jgi:hypothetical protein
MADIAGIDNARGLLATLSGLAQGTRDPNLGQCRGQLPERRLAALNDAGFGREGRCLLYRSLPHVPCYSARWREAATRALAHRRRDMKG